MASIGGVMNRKYLGIAVCIVLMLVTVSACAESDFPTGTFSIEGGYLKWEFTKNGKVFEYQDGSLVQEGIYSVRGDEFTWESHTFCGDKKATYIWTYENDTLLFTLKGEDDCSIREHFFNNKPYYKE
jgi:hypothetical protein